MHVARISASRGLSATLGGLLAVGTFLALLWLEERRPLRRCTGPKRDRNARNLALAALSACTIWLAERPIVIPFAQLVEQGRWGLLKLVPLPRWLDLALAFILLDYTLYVWHVLTHKVPLLWRFHGVHHVDLDLDASTALRFHFGEMLLSVPWRALQIMLIGVSPLALSVWQTATLLAILFHHSNVRLPVGVERWLCRLIVTPRMHGIHHSTVYEETDSNWSTIFTWPDYLHRTIHLNVPQQDVIIGLPAYRDPAQLTLAHVICLPFARHRSRWQLPDCRELQRKRLPIPPTIRESRPTSRRWLAA